MKTVLIVDDDEAICRLYGYTFQNEGYRVFQAFDGAGGLKIAEQQRPDLILLDLLMPNRSGTWMLEKMRRTTWGDHIKVIILTNISRSEAPNTLSHLGISRYLVKVSYTPKQIRQIVREVLSENS